MTQGRGNRKASTLPNLLSPKKNTWRRSVKAEMKKEGVGETNNNNDNNNDNDNNNNNNNNNNIDFI